jgi:hypothetical protein
MRSILTILAAASLVLGQDPQVKDVRDERVQVVLKNGHSLIGVAKSGVRCERLVRGKFKPCDDSAERSAGIRVWYYQDLDGYIFLEARHLDRVEVLGTLTAEESRSLAEAVAAAHGVRVHRDPGAPAAKRTDGGPDSRPIPAPEVSGITAEEKALLDRFPPAKGWSPEKFGELQRRKIVLHVNPTSEEQAFIDGFPAFQVAWKKWLATQPAPAPAPAPRDDAEGS